MQQLIVMETEKMKAVQIQKLPHQVEIKELQAKIKKLKAQKKNHQNELDLNRRAKDIRIARLLNENIQLKKDTNVNLTWIKDLKQKND